LFFKKIVEGTIITKKSLRVPTFTEPKVMCLHKIKKCTTLIPFF